MTLTVSPIVRVFHCAAVRLVPGCFTILEFANPEFRRSPVEQITAHTAVVLGILTVDWPDSDADPAPTTSQLSAQ